MRFHRRNRRIAAAIVAAMVMVPATASASPDISPSSGSSGAALTGSSPSTIGSDAAQSGVGGWVPSTDRSDAAQSGSDAAAGAPAATPTTIEIVRPERTIIRDVDEALPLILSGSALLLVLAGLAVTMLHTGMVPRPGRTH